MDEKVLIYEIKSGAHPNSAKLFSPDEQYFYWNGKYFRKLRIGDYVFVVNAYSPFVLFTKLDEVDITTNTLDNKTSFSDKGITYEVDGRFDNFIRLRILKKVKPSSDWKWTSLGMTEIVYLNGKGINLDTAEKRINNIEKLKSLSNEPELQRVLDASYSNFSNQHMLHPAILAAIGSPEIQSRINDEEFYFEKAQEQLKDFEEFQGSAEFFQKVRNEFVNSVDAGKPYKKLMADLDTESESYELLLSIGKLVSYCDTQAANKSIYNQYNDKRVLAKSSVRQTEWVKNLLNYKINQNHLDELPPNIKNAIAYLKNPMTGINMLSEDHRKLVSKNLLKKEYNAEDFTKDLIKFFEPYHIEPRNEKNLTQIFSYVLYRFPDVKKLWFEGTDEDDSIEIEVESAPVIKMDYESEYRAILTSIKTKPFILLAGLSGTGKSRLVRTLAYKTCANSELRKDPKKPGNFELIPVRPNWHDSTELMGYISRINGEKFITTSFLKFIAKAWRYSSVPFFLCLDEMNLAPVEQYFAEYLSVIETRASRNGNVDSDYLLSRADFENPDLYEQILDDLNLANNSRFIDGISIPNNLIVIGTVNMDETTHSFSRKILDRAMTFEMNVVDLTAGLNGNKIDWSYPEEFIFFDDVLGEYTAGYEVVKKFDESDKVLDYLQKINTVMEGSPFKIAYRVRDEFLIYCYYVSQIANKPDHWLDTALDEMTSMKILSRIEGDEAKTGKILEGIINLLNENFTQSNSKLEEMQNRLSMSGYTSFWS